ncbi:hypothetical protein PGT21_001167 [Puccinia graminis f. sp. tritici]|uniref:Uncharacterized protein n=1 Tax=Puccinia graminis f. sp. tritici TaxID=56615 RepID=A0A5B0QM59_PUCGR|nr:hypothetical protein PGT21_001167 [Puccinia graminis f. sp. tritici]
MMTFCDRPFAGSLKDIPTSTFSSNDILCRQWGSSVASTFSNQCLVVPLKHGEADSLSTSRFGSNDILCRQWGSSVASTFSNQCLVVPLKHGEAGSLSTSTCGSSIALPARWGLALLQRSDIVLPTLHGFHHESTNVNQSPVKGRQDVV